MKHLTNVNHLAFSVLLVLTIATGLSISVMEFYTTDTYTDNHPILEYIYMSSWAFWQTAIILFILNVKSHLTIVFDNKIVLCYNVLIILVLISDLNYLLQ